VFENSNPVGPAYVLPVRYMAYYYVDFVFGPGGGSGNTFLEGAQGYKVISSTSEGDLSYVRTMIPVVDYNLQIEFRGSVSVHSIAVVERIALLSDADIIDFGQIKYGVSIQQSFRLVNVIPSFKAYFISYENSGPFISTPKDNLPYLLGSQLAETSVYVTVSTSSTSGSSGSTHLYAHNIAPGSEWVQYTVIGCPRGPILKPSLTTLDFGQVASGTIGSLFGQITFANKGDCEAVIRSATFQDNSCYSMTNDNLFPLSIPAGQSKGFVVRFTVCSPGVHVETLKLDVYTSSPINIALKARVLSD